MSRLGEILMKKGVINSDNLERALRESKKTGEPLGETLIRLGIITEEHLLQALGEQMNIPFVRTLKNIAVPPEVIKAVPVKFVWHYKIMPLKLKDKTLTIAVSDPLKMWSSEDLKLHLGFDTELVLTPYKEIIEAIRQYYGVGADTIQKILKTQETKTAPRVTADAPKVDEIEKTAEDASVINLVNQIMAEAINNRATDIHIEPSRDKVRVRYRIDGVLYDMNIPEEIKFLHQAIVSRIKIMSHLDVVERRLPQDGRALVKVQDKDIDLRISIIPAIFGENVVIRILPTQMLFDLKELGYLSEDLQAIEKVIRKPHGILFLTGPTGSGKTTTLYACLKKINSTENKIITIEDPVEYEMENITQIQVNPKIGFTFASALRSILRHDPDVLMVGEVRDFETAELAIRTSLTGHFVFSTLHTNDACSGVTRLLDMGVESYLVASSVNAFLSQRLVRLICPHCKEAFNEPKIQGLPVPKGFTIDKFFYGKGCKKCNNIGYMGRTAIYEILPIEDKIRALILNKASSAQIQEEAVKLGMKTLLMAGWEKIKLGLTTPEELMRVVEL
jgi:type II secretory ATPase GspE/PulE/Tfp pilus assembly ATPase PilB-like protein